MLLRYETLSFDRLRSAVGRDTVAILPCAPLEVHGPHLPLGTDVLQAEHYARALAERLEAVFPDRAYLLHPTLPIGVDPLPIRGSIGHDMSVVRAVVRRVGESLHRAGVGALVVTNFHGAPRHMLALEHACHDLRGIGMRAIAPMGVMLGGLVETGLHESLDDRFRSLLAKPAADTEAHAGALETGIMMALGHEPDEGFRELPGSHFLDSGGRLANLVARVRGVSDRALGGEKNRVSRTLWQLEGFFRVTDHFNRHSYGGSPALATREIGEVAIEAFTERQADLVVRFLRARDPSSAEFQSLFWRHRRLIESGLIEWLFDGGWGNTLRDDAS